MPHTSHHPPCNADCRGGVFAVFAKIPPPIVPHHTRLFSPHRAFLPALPSASRIPCQPRLPPINVDPTVFVATWRAASRFRNRVALPKHRIAYPLRVAYPPLALHFPSASHLFPSALLFPPFFSARFTFLSVAFFPRKLALPLWRAPMVGINLIRLV